MGNSFVETIVGALVIAAAALFVFYARASVSAGDGGGYELVARFDRVDGVSAGSDIRMKGIKIGTVTALDLDQTRYLAVARLSIEAGVAIPTDSSVKITSDGLLGGAYLSVDPGGDETMLADGGEIANTQGSIDLISLISKAVFSSGSSDGSDEPAPQAP